LFSFDSVIVPTHDELRSVQKRTYHVPAVGNVMLVVAFVDAPAARTGSVTFCVLYTTV
jgi:mitochondrial fission protein ELM1